MLEWLRHAGFLFLGLSLTAHASQPYGPTVDEAKMLPDYCQNPVHWNSILGPAATWNNHTCLGINWLNRYYKSRTISEKRLSLKNALGDFNYSVSKLPSDFALMPEIYMYRGITYVQMDRVGEAVADLQKAIGMSPKLVRAHNELADLYEGKLSQPGKALEIVTEGLRHNPDVKSMQRRYTRLGGKLPYPEPIKPTPAVETEAAKLEEPATPAPSSVEPVASPTQTITEPVESVAEPKVGSPTNPYCRFCPD